MTKARMYTYRSMRGYFICTVVNMLWIKLINICRNHWCDNHWIDSYVFTKQCLQNCKTLITMDLCVVSVKRNLEVSSHKMSKNKKLALFTLRVISMEIHWIRLVFRRESPGNEFGALHMQTSLYLWRYWLNIKTRLN